MRFRSPPLTLFQKQCESPVYPNDLIIRVQPEEGISWRLNGKVPGGAMNIKPVALDFLYKTTFNVEPPEAYERLIFDAMIGDQTLFIRGDEAEAAWAVIDPIEAGWAQVEARAGGIRPGLVGAEAGDGPDRAGRPAVDAQRRRGGADHCVFVVRMNPAGALRRSERSRRIANSS